MIIINKAEAIVSELKTAYVNQGQLDEYLPEINTEAIAIIEELIKTVRALVVIESTSSNTDWEDRMGGQFTQEEINRCKNGGWL